MRALRLVMGLSVGAGLLVTGAVAGRAEEAVARQERETAMAQSLDRLDPVLGSSASAAPVARPAVPEPPMTLEPGAIHSVGVSRVARIAIGNPEVADVTVVSESELLVKAKQSGQTNLLIWDERGQRTIPIQVIDRSSELVETQLQALLREVGLPAVQVRREGENIFLLGQVPELEDLQRLEQMISAFRDVTNLVNVTPKAAAVVAPPRLVKLSVQVLEMNRQDVEKLGVKWSESVSITEGATEDGTLTEALTRVGASVSRGTFGMTINALVQQNRARILAEPKLVTATGKEASSFIGVEIPIISATSLSPTGAVTTSIEYRKTGVLLNMTPTIHDLGGKTKISTSITAEVSELDSTVSLTVPVGTQTVSIPGFKNKNVTTDVSTVPGEAVVIAGLLEASTSQTVDAVPGLGAMPVFGRFFRLPANTEKEREVVIVVTPELMSSDAAAPSSAQQREKIVEQTMAVTEVRPTIQDPMLRYAALVQERISKAIRYPAQAKASGTSGQVRLRVHVLKDGTLDQAVVAQSSGNHALDSEAVKVAVSQSPYPAFPRELSRSDLWLDLPILFRP